MRFKARESGVFIRSLAGSGEVVSVYAKAVNILHPDKLIVSLVENPSQMTALSIVMPSLFQRSENQAATVKPGNRTIFEGSRLIINDLYIDVAGGRTWEGSLGLDHTRGFCLSKIPLLRKALLQKGKRGGLIGLIHPEAEANPFVEKTRWILGRVLIKGHGSGAMKGLSQLVGLGVGFTPGGDDFISGVLLGERILKLLYGSQTELFDVGQHGSGPCSINKEEIWNRLDKTSFAGKTLLWQALQGHFPFYLIEAVRGLAAAGGLEDMKQTVARAASHGETSGTDALVGLSLCLDWVARWHVLTARSVD
jgi:hypothetical protein